MSKDYRTISIEEAIQTVVTQYRFDDTRRRIKSKAISWILCQELANAANYINELENKITQLESKHGNTESPASA